METGVSELHGAGAESLRYATRGRNVNALDTDKREKESRMLRTFLSRFGFGRREVVDIDGMVEQNRATVNGLRFYVGLILMRNSRKAHG